MVAEETFPAVDTKNDRVHIEANKRGLQRSYGKQAVILQAWGRLEDAMALFKKQETLCLEGGNRSMLAHCYWMWGLLTG
jgi:hypothetical protein